MQIFNGHKFFWFILYMSYIISQKVTIFFLYLQKPYACQVLGCTKKYTDPSSLRKHVKNHTFEEQKQLKKRSSEIPTSPIKIATPKKETVKHHREKTTLSYVGFEHAYANVSPEMLDISRVNIRQDLKNKLSEKSRYNIMKSSKYVRGEIL